jgi:hypothetical protein
VYRLTEKRDEPAIPSRFEVHDRGPDLLISWRWLTGEAWIQLGFTALWDASIIGSLLYTAVANRSAFNFNLDGLLAGALHGVTRGEAEPRPMCRSTGAVATYHPPRLAVGARRGALFRRRILERRFLLGLGPARAYHAAP